MIRAAFMAWEGWLATSDADGDVLAAKRGDPDGYAALLTRYQNRLYRYLLRWVRNEATAEDLFQQTWVRVLENLPDYDARRNFDAWLFTVARNLAVDHLRRYQPHSLDEPAGDALPLSEQVSTGGPGALDHLMRTERDSIVKRALESQPPLYREILSLRFEEEMKLEEIAELLAIPLSTVKSRLGRALERLRRSTLCQRVEEMTT